MPIVSISGWFTCIIIFCMAISFCYLQYNYDSKFTINGHKFNVHKFNNFISILNFSEYDLFWGFTFGLGGWVLYFIFIISWFLTYSPC